MLKDVQILSISILLYANLATADALEEVKVWGESLSSRDAGYTSPNSVLRPEDIAVINATTIEDIIAYEPSLVIRKRFIGDSNGTLGIRGSNMFQTSRSMVFADGVPLHYLLQSRWNGAPRWTMVSASEIDKVEVLYGPFSAEYSGNSMGGVVLIETGIPQKQEFHANITAFQQDFDAYGYDDSVNGYKGFLSYGNKVGDLSYYFSFNQLDNTSQPQTFRGASTMSTPGGVDTVNGSIFGLDARSRELAFYGDTGEVDTQTQNYKVKLGYDWGTWQSLLNIAYEDRESENTGQSYVRDLNGNTLWRATDAVENNTSFSFNSGRISESFTERDSLSLGLRVKGDVTEYLRLEFNVNQFDILKDKSRDSALHPEDPNYTTDGNLEHFDGSGWQTAEAKMVVHSLFDDTLEWVAGVRHERYELNLDQYDSADYRAGQRGNITSRFGGETDISALFTQFNWHLNSGWNMALGLRYEDFSADGGYYTEGSVADDDFTIVNTPALDNERISPKLSVGYQPNDTWLLRYSAAKAYRFPIIEELYRQYRDFNTINESNPELKPEDGTHHNLMLEYGLTEGYARINIFYETIKDAIVSQSTTLDSGTSLNSFIPIDETRTQGVELIINKESVLPQLDLRFNVTYTDAEVIGNSVNLAFEGNRFPRMPKWRSHLLATYHLSSAWNMGMSVRYASDSFGRLQNDDRIDEVYGAQDAFTFVGVKTNYEINEQFTLSVGIDNLFDERAYVAHPWPGTTAYLSVGFDL